MASISEDLRENVLLAGRLMADQVEAIDEEHIGTLDWGIFSDNLREVALKCTAIADTALTIDKALLES